MRRVAFDPITLTSADDPYAALAELRAAAPVAAVEHGFVAVTGYDAVSEVLRHPGMRSGPIGATYLASLPAGAARDELGHRINFLDPPDHPRVRRLVNAAFTPRRVAALGPWMESTIAELLDGLDPARPIDLLHDVAHQLPSLVISELLGVPVADRELLTGFSDAVAPLLGVAVTTEERARAIDAAEEFHAYLGALLDRRLNEPGDDLLSAMAVASEDGERLSRVELLSLAATLYSAGHRTTRDLFANGMSVLLTDPDRWRAVVDGSWAPAEVVAEMLRHETPTLYVGRVAGEDLTIAGTDVADGSVLLVYLAAANRDPAVFDDPTTFRPGREQPALSFAFGAHFCLGASLARSEAEVMLTAIARRWPGLRLAEPDPAALRWHLRGPFRGLDRLGVVAA